MAGYASAEKAASRIHDRRTFIKTAGLGAVPLVCSCSSTDTTVAHPDKKKNVLLICVDGLRPQLGCFGHTEMITPNIDRLASEGRLFKRHYVQSAVCGPSRCSLLTGKPYYMWDCWRKLREQNVEPSNPVALPHLFKQNGYRTVCVGKITHEPGGVVDKEQTVHQIPFSWDLAFAPAGPWKTPWRAFFSYDEGKAYNRVIQMDEKDEPRLPYEMADVPDTGYADGLNAEAAVEQLRDLKQREQPFFLAVGFYKPHLPFNAPRKYWDLYDRADIALADNPDPPEGIDPDISLYESLELTTHYHWPHGKGIVPPEDARLLRNGYNACVSYIDAQIGKVLDELERQDLKNDTIVVLWGDHGWHLGDHGTWGKQTNFEVATHSPLIVSAPGFPSKERPSEGFVGTVDVYPTLAELCGLPIPDDLAGESLVPMLRNSSVSVRDYAWSFHPTWRDDGKPAAFGHTLRTDRFRLVHWTDDDGATLQIELYDHRTDPAENTNIATRHPRRVQKLLKKLEAIEKRYPVNREMIVACPQP